MATDRDAERLYRRMLNACQTDDDREQLKKLVDQQGFYVVDALGDCANGEECTGEYRPGEGIYLSLALDRYPEDEAVLSTYLHESAHAGVFTGGREVGRHDEYFSAINRRAQNRFGLYYTPYQAHYDTHQSSKRLEENYRREGVFDVARIAIAIVVFWGLYQVFWKHW